MLHLHMHLPAYLYSLVARVNGKQIGKSAICSVYLLNKCLWIFFNWNGTCIFIRHAFLTEIVHSKIQIQSLLTSIIWIWGREKKKKYQNIFKIIFLMVHFAGSKWGGSLKRSPYSHLDLNLPLFTLYLKKQTSSALWDVCLSQCDCEFFFSFFSLDGAFVCFWAQNLSQWAWPTLSYNIPTFYFS